MTASSNILTYELPYLCETDARPEKKRPCGTGTVPVISTFTVALKCPLLSLKLWSLSL